MKKRRFAALIRVVLGFVGMFVVLFLESMGISYEKRSETVSLLPPDQVMNVKKSRREKTCLMVYDSGEDNSFHAMEIYDQVLKDMRVPFDSYDVGSEGIKGFDIMLGRYESAVFVIGNYDVFEEKIFDISSWVGEGGRMLLGMTPDKSEYFDYIAGKMGIISSQYDFGEVASFVSDPGFMLGAQQAYVITDPYESSLVVELDDQCKVVAHTAEKNLPLIWQRNYKEGRFVVCNFGYAEKAYRGIFASSYTLLDDIFAYPVINASTYYLDDFPSPVPSGNGEYIMRDYGMGIADFYSSVWWPDVLKLGDKHGIRYTGLIIENYEDKTYGELPPNDSTADYYYFGNMLLNKGGELGFHGYNHQPLCGPDFMYHEDLGYKTWESNEKISEAITELSRFSKSIFPNQEFAVYVPPSDVLSMEGRAILGSSSDIKAIASIYFHGVDEYFQEFTVADDGIVETPRIVSGGIIDDYMTLAAFSELNFHYVSSHFMHPDDLLDEDRGAELGWEKYSKRLDEYMTWLDESSKGQIRNLTGSGMGGAVQRYVNLIPELKYDYNSVTLENQGLIDTAYYFVRANEGVLGNCYGGDLTKLNDTLYLLKVKSPKVVIVRR
ncbi:MAG: DUF2194 domain-containing protein [Butyrivibrio sp.]|nr:DUF2194 domain-containing protein [Butyrivibrio sp.]